MFSKEHFFKADSKLLFFFYFNAQFLSFISFYLVNNNRWIRLTLDFLFIDAFSWIFQWKDYTFFFFKKEKFDHQIFLLLLLFFFCLHIYVDNFSCVIWGDFPGRCSFLFARLYWEITVSLVCNWLSKRRKKEKKKNKEKEKTEIYVGRNDRKLFRQIFFIIKISHQKNTRSFCLDRTYFTMAALIFVRFLVWFSKWNKYFIWLVFNDNLDGYYSIIVVLRQIKTTENSRISIDTKFTIGNEC